MLFKRRTPLNHSPIYTKVLISIAHFEPEVAIFFHMTNISIDCNLMKF